MFCSSPNVLHSKRPGSDLRPSGHATFPFELLQKNAVGFRFATFDCFSSPSPPRSTTTALSAASSSLPCIL
ncbi:hypothetical protein L596_016650 [Steinernema carpocapsae]|uniref:Uncharacterized protein n=1 Tax=Steinernema carpocapsae TaxID=34508 RepID=A0A4U5NJC3_STECR|nr:hypothetical protein L596_016650 [Steinernema carpocapsae]